MATSLSLSSLPTGLPVPEYRDRTVPARIAHIGVGGFHRAHQAMYADRLLEAGGEWGLMGIGLRDDDLAVIDDLESQDGLYTLTTVEPSGSESTRVIGSIVATRHLRRDGAPAVVAALADPAIAIVSLTITEGGYGVDLDTEEYAPRDAASLADLAGAEDPVSACGLIVDALAQRRRRGLEPFTVMSCDNIPHNGRVARAAVLGMARARCPEVVEWVETAVAFPSSMVDRITPAPTQGLRDHVTRVWDVADAAAVRAESFEQWVIEDTFCAGRPAWERAGVMVVDDVWPYELMKLRLLNASHQVMSYPALLAGLEWVHEACADTHVRAVVSAWMGAAAATLRPVPGVDLDEYREALLTRFSSPAVADTLARQVAFSSDRIATFIRPVLEDMAPADRAGVGALVVALWGAWVDAQVRATSAGVDGYRWEDPRAALLTDAVTVEQATGEPRLLEVREVLGTFGDDPAATAEYVRLRALIRDGGVRAALGR